MKRILFILISIVFFSFSYCFNSTNSCKKYSFCFDCISDYSCNWNSGKCKGKDQTTKIYNIDNNNSYSLESNASKECFYEQDFETALFIKKYCGITHYEKKNKVLIISLPSNDNMYGYNSLYCEFDINNSEEIKSLTIEATKKWGNLSMQIKYLNVGEDKELILGNEEKYVINNPKSFKIIFESNNKYETSPFCVKISNTLTPTNIVLIIICIVAGIFGLLVIIFFIKYLRKRITMKIIIKNNIKGQNNIIINNNTNNYTSEREGLLNYLNNLKTLKFKNIKEKAINNSCPIENELFDEDADVILTICHHSFHFICIKKYIYSNISLKELKCPLCNTYLYKSNNYNTVGDTNT